MRGVTDIRIEAKDAEALPHAYVLLRVRQLLRRLPVRPLAVRVHFQDDNGPKGGADIRCRMRVSLPAESPINVERVASTARLAFDRVYERIRRKTEHPRRPWRESRRHPNKYYAAKRLWTSAVLFCVLAVVLALPASASADDVVSHSGVIVAIAADARTFVVSEVGPWEVRQGATVSTRQIITLLPETQFAMVRRGDDAPSGFKGNFVEIPLGPDGVYLNDYVTVECRHEGRVMLALKITVVELPDGEPGEQTLR